MARSATVGRSQHRRITKAVDAWVDAELDDAAARNVAAHVPTAGCSSAAATTRLPGSP